MSVTRDTIVTAGLALVDEGGPQLLTMRRLAERLGVTATALYYHLDGREQVLDAIADRLCADIAAELPGEGAWTDRVRAALLGWFARTVDHPRAMGWAMVEYAKRPPVLRLHEAIMEVLDDAGFTPEAALYVKGALMRYCIGHLVIEDLSPGDDWRRELPKSAFPHYRAAGPASERFDRAEQFCIGLDAMIAGLAAGPLAPGVVTR